MKVYLADADVREAELTERAVRLYWRDAAVQTVNNSRLIVPDIFRGEYDLIVVSADLAYSDGIDRIANIRSVSDVPVIVLMDSPDDLLESRLLDAGADDVLVSPVSSIRLISHIRAALRRVDGADRYEVGDDFCCGDLVMDLRRRRVFVNSEQVMLTPTEYRLLFLLAKNADRVMSHRSLIERTWGMDTLATADHLKVNISRLRTKLRHASETCTIESARGLGYRLQTLKAAARSVERR